MSLSINNNITSLNAWRNLKQTDMRMSKTMEKLSSGLRINRAADDPAGLVISEKMRAQLTGLDAAVKNSEKAINMIQTAEAALDQVQKLLDKMRQLAIDTANLGVNDDAMRQANQDELDEAIQSVTRIADYTQFGTKKLLDGSLGTTVSNLNSAIDAANFGGTTSATWEGNFDLEITTAAAQGSVTATLGTGTGTWDAFDTAGMATGSVTFNINGVTISMSSGQYIDKVINGYTDKTGVTASLDNTGTLTLTTTGYGSNAFVSVGAASGQLDGNAAVSEVGYGTDAVATATFADGTTAVFDDGTGRVLEDGTGNIIVLAKTTTTGTISDAGRLTIGEAQFQVGANENQIVTVSIQSVKASALGIGATYTDANGAEQSVSFSNLDQLRSGKALTNGVLVDGNADQIAQAIGLIDEAVEEVSTLRGNLGAIQADNLQVQLDSLRVAYENLQASESTIRDTDMTLEMAQFTKYQIMMQAGTAMLAQANQIPNNILQLLR